MVDRFLNYIRRERRYSEHTLVSYQTDLSQFEDFLFNTYAIKDLTQVDRDMIRSWMIELLDREISSRTINRKLSCLKSFYKYLLKEGQVQLNPVKGLTAPKVSKRLPVFLTNDMISKCLEYPTEEDFYSLRENLVLEIFYQTGVRLSELVNLKVKDVDFYEQQIKVLGKRNKERIIPVSKQLVSRIKRYLEERDDCFENKSDYLVVSNQGTKTYPKLIYTIVKQCLDRLGTLSKTSPHVLRHTFATHLLNNGADINSVKELLGHASLASTQVYTHNTIKKLRSIYEHAHPRAQ